MKFTFKLIHGKAKRFISSYKSWVNMKQRCLNPDNKNYPHYGGRGIVLCKRWHEFENFYKDMGEKPKNKTLERIDNNQGYNKKNCKWASSREQQRNKRNNRVIYFNGKKYVFQDLAKEYKINALTLKSRLDKLGWPIEKALKLKPYKFKKIRYRQRTGGYYDIYFHQKPIGRAKTIDDVYKFIESNKELYEDK